MRIVASPELVYPCHELMIIPRKSNGEKSMKSRLVTVVVLTLGLFATRYFVRAQVPASSVEHKTSRIIIGDEGAISGDSTAFDFGTVWANGELSHTFVLANEGEEALSLRATQHNGAGTTSRHFFVLEPRSEIGLSMGVNTMKLCGPFEKIGWDVLIKYVDE